MQPQLGVIGWMRWGWRQLTSMRTALVLLLVLAIAAIPGSIFPQRSADPNGVTEWQRRDPQLASVLDSLSLFDVYSSPWFSAIYLLLFISLIGCVIPRIKHHAKALRSLPPRTPARLARLDDYREEVRESADPQADAATAVTVASGQLRALRYRVERYDGRGSFSVSAERGYLRETGNLLFHIALVGVLIAVGIGGGFAYTGQKVIVEGQSFVNSLIDYDSMNRGRFVADDRLVPYKMTLDKFSVSYQEFGTSAQGQAGDFAADVTLTRSSGATEEQTVRVNHPLDIEGDRIYLLGNGYAPSITVRDPDGTIVFHDAVPFLPQDGLMTSLGVVKVTDGMSEQLGFIGFFYPTVGQLETGALTSLFPDLYSPMLTLDVYEGDLGINDGTPRSVYVLDTGELTRLTGGDTGVVSLEMQPGETKELPGGRGTITFDDASPPDAIDLTQSVQRYASLQIHQDRSATWVLIFSLLALGGLMLALFVPRRRIWVRATPGDGAITLEYAGLARGEDPTLRAAVDDFADGHARLLAHHARHHPESKVRS